MKIFIRHLTILIVIVALSMIVFDKVYTCVYEQAFPRNKIQYVLQLKNKKIDYIFLGSSRVENHIVTKIVEQETGKKALNLGMQGGKLDDVFLMLKFLVHNNISTDKVFIQVDYIYNFENPSTIVGTESLPYIRSNDIIRDHRKSNDDYSLNYNIPFYRYAKNDFKLGFREFFSCLLGKRSRMDLSDGFDPKNEIFTNKTAGLPNKILLKNRNIEELNLFCKENKIDLIFFCAPFCNGMENMEYIDKLKNRIPNLIDFSRSIKSNEYFQDCAHLNEKGAKLFTQKLISSCILKP